MRATFLLSSRLFAVLVGVAGSLLAAGCHSDPGWRTRLETSRTGPPSHCQECGTAPIVSRVMPGDALIGDLHDGCQCFYFDGVEYSLLDFEMVVDCCGGTMPTLAITDPEGRPVDLGECSKGHVINAAGVILRKTGTYKGTLCKTGCADAQHYKLSYELRLAGQDDKKLYLTPCAKEQVSFIATRGANCVINILPEHSCGCVPKVVMVKGPDGMRALACENQLEGAQTPRITQVRETGRTLRFNAARPGRYTVILASEEGTEGDATAHVDVFQVRPLGRNLFHDGHPCDGACPPTEPTRPAAASRTTALVQR